LVWPRRQEANYQPLGVLSPILIFFVVVGLVGRPFLEQLQKHTWLADFIPPAVLVPLSIFFLVGLYISAVATMYFFYRAMRNINFFAGHRVVAPSAAWLMAIPFVNLLVIPYVWGRTYYLSHALNPQQQIRKSAAAILSVGTFVLILIGLATDRMSDNPAFWPPGYDGLSLAVVALGTSTAGSILFSRIVQRISAAQRLHAERQGLLLPWRDRTHEPSSSGLLALVRLAVVGLCVGTALYAAVFPASASRMLQRLFAAVGQVAHLQGDRTSSLSRMLQDGARESDPDAARWLGTDGRLMEMYELTLEAGGSSGADFYNHEGEKAGVVVAGTLRLWLHEESYILEEGDSFQFPSAIPHRFDNPGRHLARVLWINSPPAPKPAQSPSS
jgi:quercetin dioxygenase-like cupin family protein